jgi:hypothetical protein
MRGPVSSVDFWLKRRCSVSREATRRTCKKLKLSENQSWAPTKGKMSDISTPTINSQHQTIDNQEPTTTIDSQTRQTTVSILQRTPDNHNKELPPIDTPDNQHQHPTPDIQPTPKPDNQKSTTDTNKMQQDKIEINPFMLHWSRT